MSLHVDILSYIVDELKVKDPRVAVWPDSTSGQVMGFIRLNMRRVYIYIHHNSIRCGYECGTLHNDIPPYIIWSHEIPDGARDYHMEEPYFGGVINAIWDWLSQDD